MEVAGPDHEEFRQRAASAHAWELWVGAMLLETGLPVQVPLLELAETPYEAERFIEQNDVLCGGWIIEVKTRTFPFTCAKDFPHPTAFTCAVKRWDARKEKPIAVVIVSQPTQVALAVSATMKGWTIATPRDSHRDHVGRTYEAPLEELRPFPELIDWLRVRGPK
jgi:hypothetical protein